MTDLEREPDHATILSPDERRGLKPAHITFRDDLNLAEQINIAKATVWAMARVKRQAHDELLSEDFIKRLHRRMLGEVWAWAGTFRKTESNIGIAAHRIPVEFRLLIDDARTWIARASFPADEIAVRVHHRLVAIHPFPNGNGRHARLMADLLITSRGGEAFSWGKGRLNETGQLRAAYIAALRAADGHDIGPLVRFARG